MKNKVFLAGMAGVMILFFGCNKGSKALIEKGKTREDADKAVKQVEQLERDMQQTRDLEQLEKETEKITGLKEPAGPAQ